MNIDASSLQPMVATPGDPGNGVGVDEIGDVPVDIVYAGSCTGAKRDDVAMAARVVECALAERRVVAEGVDAYLQYGSVDVERYAMEQGWHERFLAVGIRVLAPGCGACINAGPGVSGSPDQVTVSSINRNFPGRSGPGKVYLASPFTVLASAFAGKIVGFEEPETAAV